MHVIGESTTAAETNEGVRAVRLRLPARAEYIVLGRLALTGLSVARTLIRTISDLKLALTEAVSNAVRHAYATQGEARSRSATSFARTA